MAERNSSVFKFAKESGIGRSTIVNLCAGNSKSPTLATLFQICDALNISILDFLSSELFARENIEIE